MIVCREIILNLITNVKNPEGGGCKFGDPVTMKTVYELAQMMSRYVKMHCETEEGKDFGKLMQNSRYNTCRVARFLNLWMGKCPGYEIQTVVPNFDVLGMTAINFVEALIVTLIELIQSQSWKQRGQSACLLHDLFTCWIPTLKAERNYSDCYDWEMMMNLCDFIDDMAKKRLDSGIVDTIDFRWLRPCINIHALCLRYYMGVLDPDSMLLSICRFVQICTYYSELADTLKSLHAAVKLFNELIIDFPEILQRVRVEDLDILLSLSEFARGGTVCVPICSLMADLVLLPGEPIRWQTLDRIKPCLFLACDRPPVLGENVTEKCLHALKSALENLPDLFTDEEVEKVRITLEELDVEHDGNASSEVVVNVGGELILEKNMTVPDGNGGDESVYNCDDDDDFRTLSATSNVEEFLEDEDAKESSGELFTANNSPDVDTTLLAASADEMQEEQAKADLEPRKSHLMLQIQFLNEKNDRSRVEYLKGLNRCEMTTGALKRWQDQIQEDLSEDSLLALEEEINEYANTVRRLQDPSL